MQASPSRKNLSDPDEQICSGLGQSYESPKSFSRVRKMSGSGSGSGSGNGNGDGTDGTTSWSFHGNGNGSMKLSHSDSIHHQGAIVIKKKEGFMPTPRRAHADAASVRINRSSVLVQDSIGNSPYNGSNARYTFAIPTDSHSHVERERENQENQENQENLSFDPQTQPSNNDHQISNPSSLRAKADSDSDSPIRASIHSEQQNHLRRSARNQQANPVSTTPTSSPQKPRSDSVGHSPIKLKAKLTDGVSRPKSKANKPPPVPNVVHHASSTSNSVGGRGLGISLGLQTVRDQEKFSKGIRRIDVDEMDQEVEMELGMEDSSFVFHDVSEGSVQDEEDGEQDSVKVHVRLRPPKPGGKCAWIPSVSSATLTLDPALAQQRVQPGVGLPHKVDGICTGSDNQPVYSSVARPLIRAALEGYDAVIFAYGQTASGKTYTLGSATEEGIIQKSIKDIFRGIRQSSKTREWLLRCSYLELFNEKVLDLLEPENKPQIRDDRKKGGKGIFVSPLREEIVINEGQIRDLLKRGQENRHVGQTDWNERSSRSHTCFKVTIESWERDSNSSSPSDFGEGDSDGRSSPSKEPPKSRVGKKIRVSELSLIDLAGSEKYVSQGSDRRTEGAHINKSLLTLAKVIYALSERSSSKENSNHSNHVPYRDSKLTRILQNSLSGNSKISVVCTINPNINAIDESLSTLNFAKRVKKVNLNAKRNEIEGWNDGMDGMEAKALLIRYRREMDQLRTEVKELRRNGGNGDLTPTNNANGSFGMGAGVDDDRVKELKKRLKIIENLVVRGGGGEESDEEEQSESTSGDPARPVSPLKPSFSAPSHVLQERLYSANQRIGFLEKKLSSRPSLSSTLNTASSKEIKERDQLKLITKLQNQVRELEMVCEAQTIEAPPKIREDVEREWKDKVEDLERKLTEREGFVKEQNEEIRKLRRANQQLIRLAHSHTADMVNSLNSTSPETSTSTSSRQPIPQSLNLSSQPRFNVNGDNGRPSSVIGTSRMGLLPASNRNSFIPSSPFSPSSSPRPCSRNTPLIKGDFGTPTSTTSRPSRFRPRRSSQ